MKNTILHVCLPHTGQDYYDYLLTEEVLLTHELPGLGARVKVSFRQREAVGVVVGYSDESKYQKKLKSVDTILDVTPWIGPIELQFYQWMAQYYHASWSEVMNLALPKHFREGRVCEPVPEGVDAITSQRALESPLIFNEEQQSAYDAISMSLGRYQCFLLHGITGSGKTEVYLQTITKVIAQGQQVLVLVPEIGLTPQLIHRFQARFSETMAVMHSHLNDKERYTAWRKAVSGQARIILGTRSALFTPLPQLGLIIVDEEHDLSFKQQDGVKYSARDGALIRAHMSQVPVILGTATPSLESYKNARSGKYHYLKLTQKACAKQDVHYEIVDLRNQPVLEGLCEKTYQKIQQHLERNQQVLVFVNRRGFAPVLMCQDCGHMADCSACERHSTVHQKIDQLICHHCGRQERLWSQCHRCGSRALLTIGIGTQRLYQALHQRFPLIAMAQIDRDELSKKHALDQALEAIAQGKTQLMIGTQLLTKGHHFPNLSLVVVVDVDAGLYHPDFRSLERLGQVLLQVAGRAGREKIPGEVLIQTYVPHHPMLNLLIQQGYDAFAERLLEDRKLACLPPFVFSGMIRAQGRRVAQVEAWLHTVKQQLKRHAHASEVQVWGPAPAMMPKKAGLYRMQLCIMSPTRQQLHECLHGLRQMKSSSSGIRWSIEVDPLELS